MESKTKVNYQSKIFCKGIFCNTYDRKNKCCDCGKYVCGVCEIPSMTIKGNVYCPGCYLKTFNPDWNKLNKEFDEMIKSNANKKVCEDIKENANAKTS